MPAYAQLSRLSQIARLRPYAIEFAARFGLAGSRISVATHAYNTTFRLDHPQGRFALRINVNSIREPGHILTEAAWLDVLEREGAPTLRLRRTPEGESVVIGEIGPLGRPLMAVCSHWIEGRKLSSAPSDRDVREVGKLTAQLHKSRPALPPEAVPAPVTNSLMGDAWIMPDRGFGSAALEDALALSESALTKLCAIQPAQLLHYDLHQWNLKKTDRGLVALDFDDCRLAPPLMDAAITHYYMRGVRGKAIDKPYFEGLGYWPADAGLSEFEFESLVFGRRIMLANAFFSMAMTTGPRPEEYAQATVDRAEHFMRTKVYDPRSLATSS